jgi:hypothetical protein
MFSMSGCITGPVAGPQLLSALALLLAANKAIGEEGGTRALSEIIMQTQVMDMATYAR